MTGQQTYSTTYQVDAYAESEREARRIKVTTGCDPMPRGAVLVAYVGIKSYRQLDDRKGVLVDRGRHAGARRDHGGPRVDRGPRALGSRPRGGPLFVEETG